MILWSKSMSLTFRFKSSTGLSPVSLAIESLIAKVDPEFAISISSFSLVGILMDFPSVLYNGMSHWIL